MLKAVLILLVYEQAQSVYGHLRKIDEAEPLWTASFFYQFYLVRESPKTPIIYDKEIYYG